MEHSTHTTAEAVKSGETAPGGLGTRSKGEHQTEGHHPRQRGHADWGRALRQREGGRPAARNASTTGPKQEDTESCQCSLHTAKQWRGCVHPQPCKQLFEVRIGNSKGLCLFVDFGSMTPLKMRIHTLAFFLSTTDSGW